MRICSHCALDLSTDGWQCPACGATTPLIDGFRAFAPTLAADGPGFDQSYFSQLASLEDANFWFRGRNALISWAIERYFPEALSVLEIGCGTGYVLREISKTIPAARLVGSEVFVSGLAFASKRVPHAEFYQIDATAIPFRGEFDLIGAFDVIEHIEDDDTVLQQVALALVPGGGVIITVPQHPSMWSPQDDLAHHVRRYTARGLARKLDSAGLDILRMTSFTSILLPIMVASRLHARFAHRGAFDVMDELRQPRAVGALLGSAMTLERTLIRMGLSLPAGGSVLVVARRRRSADAST